MKQIKEKKTFKGNTFLLAITIALFAVMYIVGMVIYHVFESANQ